MWIWAFNQERVVLEADNWVVVVPWWAVWPYETMVLPKRAIQRFSDISEAEKLSLADTIKRLTTKYDNLFETYFPYSMGFHGNCKSLFETHYSYSYLLFSLSSCYHVLIGAPTGPFLKEDNSHWIFHGIYYPPLLRSGTVKKFMVG
jgi:UDPglucose--hexose-1-phosphate uridylyltransferase